MPDYFCNADIAYPRLDRYIAEELGLLSRSQIKARKLKAVLNGKEVKLSRNIEPGDEIKLYWEDEPPDNIIAENLPLDIIYEDDKQIIINKAQGMVVHPGAGNRQGTFANAIFYRMLEKNKTIKPEDNSITHCLRPGIVHRLDKETSGVIIAAYDEDTHAFLSRQFKNRKVRKTYIAIVQGIPKEKKGRIETFIARDPRDRKKFTVADRGRNALTFYKVLKSWGSNLRGSVYSLVLLRPKTGRTHQLRVHMKHIGCPILGDPLYAKKDKNFPDATLMLHSKGLEITLNGEKNITIFATPLPKRFSEVKDFLNKTGI